MDSTQVDRATLSYLTIREARRLLDSGQVSALELAEAAISRIYDLDSVKGKPLGQSAIKLDDINSDIRQAVGMLKEDVIEYISELKGAKSK